MKSLIVACAAGLMLSGCITAERARNYGNVAIAVGAIVGSAKADAEIAKVSARLAQRCGDLKAAAIVSDLFVPEKVRVAVQYGEAVIITFCAAPPKTAAEIGVAIAKVIEAIAVIEEAKRAP